MARFGDIVAYQYRADLYCQNCIRGDVFLHTVGGDDSTTEQLLDVAAEAQEIDREDERTFDSDEFPKVVLFDNLHDQGERFYCGNCHNELES